MTWRDKIINALKSLNGEGTLKEIYEQVAIETNAQVTELFKASIRDALQRNSSDSEKFNGNYDCFYCVDGKGNGKWGLRDFNVTEENMDFTQDDSSFVEGRKLIKKHLCRERNHALILTAKNKFKNDHDGKIFCEICEFNFSEVYGDIGDDFIEAHHIKPVSKLIEGEKTRVEDLVMVCSNCHSMLHRKKPWLEKEQLKMLICYNYNNKRKHT